MDATLKALSFPVFESDSFLNSISLGIFSGNRTELDEKSADLHTSSQVDLLCKCTPLTFPPPFFFLSHKFKIHLEFLQVSTAPINTKEFVPGAGKLAAVG